MNTVKVSLTNCCQISIVYAFWCSIGFVQGHARNKYFHDCLKCFMCPCRSPCGTNGFFDALKFKEIASKSNVARCRLRFPAPVILCKGKV